MKVIDGIVIYETVEDILEAKIEQVYDYEGFYFIALKPESVWDNSAWIMNKSTKEVKHTFYTAMFEAMDNGKKIDVNEFKEILKRAL